MSKNKFLATSVLAVVLGAASVAAQAAEPIGFYGGAGVGRADFNARAVDDHDTGYQLFGGYQFHPNFGAELAYTDFGKADVGPHRDGVDANAVSLSLVGTLPFTEKFSGYAKAGVSRWDTSAHVGPFGFKDHGTDPTAGVGLQYRFNDKVALRGEYSRFNLDEGHTNLAQVQVRYDF